MNLKTNIFVTFLKIKFQLLPFMAYQKDKTGTYNKKLSYTIF